MVGFWDYYGGARVVNCHELRDLENSLIFLYSTK